MQGKRTVTDEEILQEFREVDEPFLTAAEVGDRFGLTRQWAHSRLKSLYEDGELDRKSPGQRTVIWWLDEG